MSLVFSHFPTKKKGWWSMDPITAVTERMCSLILGSKPSEALALGMKYYKLVAFRNNAIFVLNCAHAAIRSKSKITNMAHRAARYRVQAKKCANYDPGIEANFWHAYAENAELRKNLPAALTMYRWAFDLTTSRYRKDLISRYIERIEGELRQRQKTKYLSRHTKKPTTAKPRHK